ncbi:MAG: hypothetical protein HFH19_01445 [Ruminococcus sp.]|nr:hypothetical protein [Schaedlerella arabinosiphila]MCI9602891.1 hypothetical protein [Ruminococcus sp.]
MGQENKIEYAGNLLEEIQELDKMVYDMDNNLTQSTLTRNCAAVLTIYCC